MLESIINSIQHVLKACKYTYQGLCSAWRDERAFRIEVICFTPFILITPWLTHITYERIALITSLLLVIVVELLNSSIEAAIDRIGLERNPLSGKSKDLSSAAVGVSLLIAAIIWATILL